MPSSSRRALLTPAAKETTVSLTLRQTLEIHVAGTSGEFRAFSEKINLLRASLPDEYQPLLLGPVTPPRAGGWTFVFVHDGGVYEAGPNLWNEAAGELIAAMRYMGHGRCAISFHDEAQPPEIYQLYSYEGTLYSDPSYSHVIDDPGAYVVRLRDAVAEHNFST